MTLIVQAKLFHCLLSIHEDTFILNTSLYGIQAYISVPNIHSPSVNWPEVYCVPNRNHVSGITFPAFIYIFVDCAHFDRILCHYMV